MKASVTVLNIVDDLNENPLFAKKFGNSMQNTKNIPKTTTTTTTAKITTPVQKESRTATATATATASSMAVNYYNNNNNNHTHTTHTHTQTHAHTHISNSTNSNYNSNQASTLLYVAASSLASVVNSQENISIVYEDFLESNSIINRSLLPTTTSTSTSAAAVAAAAAAAAATATTTTFTTATSYAINSFGNDTLDATLSSSSVAASTTSSSSAAASAAAAAAGAVAGIASSSSSATSSSLPMPTTTAFGHYNESAAAAEWSHFYDLILSWQGICLIAVFCTFIVITIIGNTLVILAVITTRRLKTVTNCFVMSLAVADLLVGIFVMPPAVAVHLIGSWQLGWILCDLWVSLDVLLCTASILSLCAISVDRYLAVTRPLTYSRKRRSKRLALIMILIVWLLALAITCPPMLGWYEPGRRDLRECRYNQNEGYVIFSAMGSFFIPMAVMIYVYARISCVIASRHDNMTDISIHNKKFKRYTAADVENDNDHEYSEQELSSGQKKQAAVRTFSNQTIDNEVEVIIRSDSDNCGVAGGGGGGGTEGIVRSSAPAGNCHSMLALPSTHARNGCYELTRPASLKRTPTASTTMTTMTSGCGAGMGVHVGSSLLDAHWQNQRAHSFRNSAPIGGGGGGGSSSSAQERSVMRGHHHHHHFTSTTTATTASSTAAANKSLSNRITSLKKENKTTQTLSIVVGGFIACWLPFFIYYLITPFLEQEQVSPTLSKVLTWLGWFNSAINPFIYAFYSVDFRAAFWRLTCKRFFSGTQKPHLPTNTMSIRR